MRKLVSALIIMTMILTAWSVPMSVSAADAAQSNFDTVLFDEDFEGYKSIEEVDGIKSSKENFSGVQLVDSGDVTRGQVLKLSREDAYSGIRAAFVPTTYITASAWMKVEGANSVSMGMRAYDSEGNSIALCGLWPSDKVGYGNGSGSGYNGYPTYSGKVVGKWLLVEVTVNLLTDTMTHKVTDVDGNVIHTSSSDTVTYIDNIEAIEFRNNTAKEQDTQEIANYFDDLVITREGGCYLDEDFENCDAITDINNIGSYNSGDWTGVSLVDDTDANRGKVVMLNRTDGASGAAKHSGVNTTIETTSKVKLSAWVKVGSECDDSIALRVFDKAKGGIELCVFNKPNTMIGFNKGDKNSCGSWTAKEFISLDAWYWTEITIDLDKDSITYKVFDNSGNIIETYTSEETSYISQMTGIYKAEIRSKNGTTAIKCYFDDFVVSHPNYVEESTILNEDFEGDTNVFADATISTNVTDTKGVEGSSKMGEIVAGKNTTGIIDIKDIYGGAVQLSYDAYVLQNDRIIRGYTTSGTQYDLLQLTEKKVKLTQSGTEIASGLDGVWVHIEQLLNFDAGTVRTKVYSMEKRLLGEGINNAGCDSIAKIAFVNMSPSATINLDNIVVKSAVDRPEVKEIAAYDIYGDMIESVTSAVGVKEIVVTFDEEIDELNPSNYFVLKKADGINVKFTGEVSGNVYTMTLNETLDSSSEYTVKVLANVMDTDGYAAGENYTSTLTTVAASEISNEVKINSFVRADDKLTVEAGYINAGSDTLPMVFMVAFYDENGAMLGINEPVIKSGADAYGRMTMTFADYTGEGTVAETKLFFWDSLLGMHPYGGVVTL